jgi:hypothetical protein
MAPTDLNGGRRPGSGGGLGAWVKRNKTTAAAVGVVGLVGALVLIRKSNSSGAAPSSAGTTVNPPSVDPSLYGGSGADPMAAYAGEMGQLQDLLNAYTAGQLTGPVGPKGPAGPPGPAYRPPKPPVRRKPPVRVFPPIKQGGGRKLDAHQLHVLHLEHLQYLAAHKKR